MGCEGRRPARGGWWWPAGAAGLAAAMVAASAVPGQGASQVDPRAGRAQYERLCAVCHGPEGKGDGQALRGMPVRPRSFADPATFRDLPDQALFDAIKKGGAAVKKSPVMPPFGDQLRDAQIWELVAFVKSLAAPPR